MTGTRPGRVADGPGDVSDQAGAELAPLSPSTLESLRVETFKGVIARVTPCICFKNSPEEYHGDMKGFMLL